MALVTRLGAVMAALVAALFCVIPIVIPIGAGQPLPAPDTITLSPVAAAPEEKIDIRVFCPQDAALATSPATTPVTLWPAAGGGLFGDTKVKPHAAAGTYTMTIRCGMRVFRVPFIVHAPATDRSESPGSVIVAALILALSLVTLAFLALRLFRPTPPSTRLPDGRASRAPDAG